MFRTRHALNIVAAMMLGGLAAGAASADEKPFPKGAAVLTVAGKTTNWNRGAMAPERDNLLKQRDIKFERAMAFDWDMLAGLPQHELKVVTPVGEGAYKGPLLTDVLSASGAQDGKVRLVSLDGSATELDPKELKGENWVLTLSVDGKPVGIGDFGPVWLMHKPASGAMPSKEEMDRWIWSVFYIEVL
jgi:hypothetical protein